MQPSTIPNTDEAACCGSCRSRRLVQHRRIRRRIRTTNKTGWRWTPSPVLALLLFISSSFLQLWSVHAFTTIMPRVDTTTRQLVKALPLEKTLSRRKVPSPSTSSRLAAINSRELRFYSGGKGLPKAGSAVKSQGSVSSSMPEVLVASMSNYFFGSATRFTFDSHETKTTAPAAALVTDEEQTFVGSSTSTVTTINSKFAAATSSGTVLAPAPRDVLLSGHTFRASSTSSGSGPDHDDEEIAKGLRKRTKKMGTTSKQKNQQQQQQQELPDDNTSPLHELQGRPSMIGGAAVSSSVANGQYPPPRQGYGYSIQLTDEEKSLFHLLRKVHEETHLTTTLRVAGGWVRDKLLATPEFQIFHQYGTGTRLTSKFKSSSNYQKLPPSMASMGRKGTKILTQDHDQGPVDIDIALDTMLGREFADHLNAYLQDHGKDTVSVGVVLKNPEKSKHLETATMKVGSFWIDFVNLRAEEYAEDSRIPDLMRIGTAKEDAFRRDLTINSLFFNINTGQVEDWTGRGFADLRRGVVATPLAPLTTLLDDPLRVLRSIRFAARLRFTMDEELVTAAKDDRVRIALEQKVSRERVGGEVDLMLRSPDPVGAMRLLSNLNLVDTVFPLATCLASLPGAPTVQRATVRPIFDQCLNLLSTTHDHLFDCKISPPCWCQTKKLLTTQNVADTTLTKDEEARRLLWFAAFLKPIHDYSQRLKQKLQDPKVSKRAGKKANRSIMSRLLVDELKRPGRDAEAVEKIMNAANEISQLIQSGCDVSATLILLSDVKVTEHGYGILECSMRGRSIDPVTEEDPVWEHAMEFRLLCARVLQKVGGLWRAALMLSLSEQLASLNHDDLEYTIEGDVFDESKEEQRLGIIEQYDGFATALQQIGLIGVWGSKPLVDGQEMKEVLPFIPRGPAFREVMIEQEHWMITHPGAGKEPLTKHLQQVFSDFAVAPEGAKSPPEDPQKKSKKKKATEKKRTEKRTKEEKKA